MFLVSVNFLQSEIQNCAIHIKFFVLFSIVSVQCGGFVLHIFFVKDKNLLQCNNYK